MELGELINHCIHALMIRKVMHAYDRKSKRVEKKYPELFKPVDPIASEKHKALWSRTGLKSSDRWLRVHVNLTGIQDYTFCPEDIFFTRIERVMNDCDNGMGPEEKNELWRYVPKGVEPEVVLRYVRGSFFDGEAKWISPEDAQKILDAQKESVVGKPCRASGGSRVQLYQPGELKVDWIAKQDSSYVVQKKIVQSDFCASFNKSSINTLRMMTMRCPWSGEVVVCRSMMRMGVSDAVVDNMMKGGLCVCIGDGGQFGKYAYDYDGKRFERHPVSGHTFEGLVYPDYDKVVALAKEIHAQIPFYNLLSFDFVPRKDDRICVVEINATSQGITQLQYDFGGLFGKYSEQVVDWVSKNLKNDQFQHLRTWY